MRMLARALPSILVAMLAGTEAWAACTTSICVGDPCTITGTHTIDHACQLMFADQAVTIAPGAVLDTAPVSWIAIHAKSLTVAGRIRSPGGTLNVSVDEDLAIPASGVVDMSTNALGSGDVDLYAGGSITLAGTITTTSDGYGGYLNIQAEDDIVVTGTIDGDGDDAGPDDYTIGADVYLDAGGQIRMDGTIDANARGNTPGDGGIVDLWTWLGDLRIGPTATVRANGVDGGSGGTIRLTGAGALTMDGTLVANGPGPAGAGGSVEIDGSTVTVTGDCSANGGNGSQAGGGTIEIFAGSDLSVASSTAAQAIGNGQGGDISFDGGGHTSVAANATATSNAGGSVAGRIWASAGPGKTLVISGTFDVRATAPNATDGTIFLSSCNVNVQGTLRARQGAHNQGAIVVTYTGALTVAGTGQLTAGSVGGNTARCTCSGVNMAANTCAVSPSCASPPVLQAGATVAPSFRSTPVPVTPCHCDDGVKSGSETGIDCGGLACKKCPAGQPCSGPGDCVTGICSGGTCATALCTDGVQNGSETDIDCGGADCQKCPVGQKCIGDDDCRLDDCQSGICRDPTCDDGVLNGWESDVDCGGFYCGPCGPGRRCRQFTPQLDCTSGVCVANVCQAPACPDGVLNGAETDLDCGGPSCSVKCGTGKHCLVHADCESDACFGGSCQAPACPDTRRNGNETDQDCGGGPPCPACPDGWRCLVRTDCQSGVCTDGECQPPACDDAVKNGGESGTDCGGPTSGPLVCDRCKPGETCLVPGDCDSGVCTGGTCQAPTCGDAVKNGSETDQDCGGPTSGPLVCDRCKAGRACLVPNDCESNTCTGGTCQPTCTDGVKDGAETDKDCGGPTSGPLVCDRCEPGQTCLVPGDCDSGVCTGGHCKSPACGDGVKNGAETDKDCGGPTSGSLVCGRCVPGQTCLVHADCNSSVCTGGKCQAPTCNDHVRNQGESDEDCGGSSPCRRCNPGETCTIPGDCQTGVCGAGGTCKAATCSDNVKNGAETDIDCGGATCAKCKPGQTCKVANDCTSRRCPAASRTCDPPDTCQDDYDACRARCSGFDQATCECLCRNQFCNCPTTSGRRRCIPQVCPL
jgi:hypothetical protein